MAPAATSTLCCRGFATFPYGLYAASKIDWAGTDRPMSPWILRRWKSGPRPCLISRSVKRTPTTMERSKAEPAVGRQSSHYKRCESLRRRSRELLRRFLLRQ